MAVTTFSSSIGMLYYTVIFCALFSFLCPTAVIGEWKTEDFELVPGWNAIYLHVDPSHEPVDVLMQRTPVTQVWMWAPSTSTAQFVTSVQSDSDFGSNWISWDAIDPTNSSLQHLIGNAGYLVYVASAYDDGNADQIVSVGQPYTLSFVGKAVPPTYSWTASGQNFVGFSTRAGFEPSSVRHES